MMEEKSRRQQKDFDPGRIRSYFLMEKGVLAVVAVTGIAYNLGMVAGPWFEGQLAQCFADILRGLKGADAMVRLALLYVLVILFVQGMRALKRLYVRRFANDLILKMKGILYANILYEGRGAEQGDLGRLMTNAISDVDACVEGMRKFTTEVFDTGVVMVAYLGMLLYYDWRLTLIVALFPPLAYLLANRLKTVVTASASAYKESAGRLNGMTMDRISNAVTYRIYGLEGARDALYEESLSDYEKKAVRANVWETSMQPVYHVISMIGAFFILWLGGRNVLGSGWTTWNIAAFSTYLACFAKLAVKSSKAAKLFNAVQKAKVSWARIKPHMHRPPEDPKAVPAPSADVTAEGLSFAYPGGATIFQDLDLTARPGGIVGVTGPVASGKSTLGRAFLAEYPYAGSLRLGGEELSSLASDLNRLSVSYTGHQSELFSFSVEENILLGAEGDVMPVLRAVCLDEEVLALPQGIHTPVGDGGTRLSGGQQARLSLARALFHAGPVLVLDDPFASVDPATEKQIFTNMKELCRDSVIVLLSHRLSLFPELDQVVWLDGRGGVTVSDHASLMEEEPAYRELFLRQTEGGEQDA